MLDLELIKNSVPSRECFDSDESQKAFIEALVIAHSLNAAWNDYVFVDMDDNRFMDRKPIINLDGVRSQLIVGNVVYAGDQHDEDGRIHCEKALIQQFFNRIRCLKIDPRPFPTVMSDYLK